MDQQYHNNLNDYHLVNNINCAMKNIMLDAIDNQWLKGVKYIIMRYVNKAFVELMCWLYILYRQITPEKLMKNQGRMHSLYHVDEPIKMLFNQIKTGQKFAIL